MILPLFRKGAQPATPEERRATIEGWFYARFVTAQLMESILKDKARLLRLEVFDRGGQGSETLVFDSDPPGREPPNLQPPRFSTTDILPVGQRLWRLRYSSKPAFKAAVSRSTEMLVAAAGGVISLLLFGITLSLSVTRARVVAMAEDMTVALRDANAGLHKEIRNRQRTQQELEHERFLLRALMDNLPDRIYFKDAQGRFLRNSRAQLKRLGIAAPHEAIGRTDFDFLAEEAARRTSQDEQQVLRTGEPITKEERTTSVDGGMTWELITQMPLRDETGQIIGTFGISRDITDLKSAEEAMRERVQELDCLYAIARLIEKEDSLERILQGSAEVLPKGCLYPEIACARISLEGRHYQTTNFRASDWRLSAPFKVNGQPLGMIVLCYLEERPARNEGPFLTEEKNLINAIAERLGRVIEQKQAEEALSRSETKFRTLYDSTRDAVMLLDEKGFFDCNQATLAVFGCATREEFCSKHPADLSPPVQPDGTDSWTLAGQRIATALEKGSHDFEWVHKRVDTGESFPAGVLLSAMELDGKPVLQAVVRDITERKRMENKLLQARDEAEEANRTKSRFLANMSHELRTPLNSVIGFASTLLKNKPGNLNASDLNLLDRIHANGKHLLVLINEILDVSKIEACRVELQISPVDLGQLVRDPGEVLGRGEHLRLGRLRVEQRAPRDAGVPRERTGVECRAEHANRHRSVPGKLVDAERSGGSRQPGIPVCR
jgi:PAS domain S-box-containing protein